MIHRWATPLVARERRPLHVAGELRDNWWQGVRNIEFRIEDAAWA